MVNSWQPRHRAVKMLGVDASTLYKMRDSGDYKLGKHYGAGPMTRCRDTYYWNIPLVATILKQKQEQKTACAV
jgi:hypothetical protein